MESTRTNNPKVIVLTGASSGIGEATARHPPPDHRGASHRPPYGIARGTERAGRPC